MKKAQIMGAIALAMALGVVAPIAGVVGGANAWQVVDADAHGKASCADAKKVAAGMAENGNYIAYNNLLKDSRSAKEADSTITGHTTVDTVDAADFDALVGSTTGIIGRYDWLTTNSAAQVIKDTTVLNSDVTAYTNLGGDNKKLTLDLVKSIITDAKKVPAYSVWEEILDVIEAKGAANAKVKDLSSNAISVYNNVYATNISADDVTLLTALPDYNAGGKYELYVQKVRAAEDLYNAYKPHYDKVMADIEAVHEKELLTAAGETNYKKYVSEPQLNSEALIPTLTNVYGLVFANIGQIPAFGFAATVFNNVEWNAYFADVETLSTCNANDPTNTDSAVYDKIIKAMGDYRKVVEVDAATKNYQIAESLLNAGSNNNNDGAGDKEDEDKDTPSADAPAAGILGSANGTATTVSIVAGLATALSALGAGVVAYRSARRSK